MKDFGEWSLFGEWCARGVEDQHVLPLDDFREHVARRDCWCCPIESEPYVWLHRALDGREKFETGERKLT